MADDAVIRKRGGVSGRGAIGGGVRKSVVVELFQVVVGYGSTNPLLLRAAVKEAMDGAVGSAVMRVLGRCLEAYGRRGKGMGDCVVGVRNTIQYIEAVVDCFGREIGGDVRKEVKTTVEALVRQGEILRVVGGEEKGWRREERRGGYIVEKLEL